MRSSRRAVRLPRQLLIEQRREGMAEMQRRHSGWARSGRSAGSSADRIRVVRHLRAIATLPGRSRQGQPMQPDPQPGRHRGRPRGAVRARPAPGRRARRSRRGAAQAFAARFCQPCLDHRLAAGVAGRARDAIFGRFGAAGRSADGRSAARGRSGGVPRGRPVAAKQRALLPRRPPRSPAGSISSGSARSSPRRRWPR